MAQVTGDMLGKMFSEVRDRVGFHVPAGMTPFTFHEIRALASDRLKSAGYSVEEVQKAMAHTDSKVTKGYQAGHEVEFTEIDTWLSAEHVGRGF